MAAVASACRAYKNSRSPTHLLDYISFIPMQATIGFHLTRKTQPHIKLLLSPSACPKESNPTPDTTQSTILRPHLHAHDLQTHQLATSPPAAPDQTHSTRLDCSHRSLRFFCSSRLPTWMFFPRQASCPSHSMLQLTCSGYCTSFLLFNGTNSTC